MSADDKSNKPSELKEAEGLLEPEVQVLHQTRAQRFCKFVKDNLFMTSTIVGVLLGFILGVAIRAATDPEDRTARFMLWLNMPGDLFIRLLKLTILPLIAANVVVVSANLDPKVNGKISLVSFGYIIVANVGSALIGCVTALLIQPGINRGPANNGTATQTVKIAKLTSSDVFADLLFNIFPDNLVGVALFKTQTVYKLPLKGQLASLGLLGNDTIVEDARSTSNSSSVNMIGVIFCAAVFGMAARTTGEQGRPFIAFFQSLAHVVIKVMRWFLWLTPPGVCFMIAASVVSVLDPQGTFMKLGLFILSVTVGLAVHFILLQVVFIVVSRKNPLYFLPNTVRSWFISFATTAPVVAIPEMIECCDRYGLSQEVSRFVIPFAAAIKGDGSACFIAVAAVFLAQLTGFPVTAGTIVVIILLVSSAMLALPNIPSASLVILVTILTSVGISETEVGLLYAVDWLLDRMRSGSIGLSHLYCAAFTHFLCADDLKRQPAQEIEQGGDGSGANGQSTSSPPAKAANDVMMVEIESEKPGKAAA
ncbi:hypothetical protein BOX15_Mlig028619g1 [Macrostomum lignano]|uniref:Amino acid transporter n=1 Tax=Macrostomum lignano TaxID=282301 RepID=A0A267FGV7_9PLAT|nr:hypothetical protein BOX15_Mlig028619g1 [Macrostomum lignano]